VRRRKYYKAGILIQECPSGVTEEAGFFWNVKKSIFNFRILLVIRGGRREIRTLETPAPAIFFSTEKSELRFAKTEWQASCHFARFVKQASDFTQIRYEGIHLQTAGFVIDGAQY